MAHSRAPSNRPRFGGALTRAARASILALAAMLPSVACRDTPGGSGGGTATTAAPDSFLVAFETSAGEFAMMVHRAWSPAGADRIHELALNDHFAGARIYRVNERYAQFGYTGRPGVDSLWVPAGLPDEPVRASNVRGTVSFARGGPASRSVVLFINRDDNSDLDALEWRGVVGFPPVGRIVGGMEVVDRFRAGHGEEPLYWEDSIAALGNEFLDRRFPGLDSILAVGVAGEWP